ncbi:MAG: phospholipase D family protein [Bdellovibrionota bacterium]
MNTIIILALCLFSLVAAANSIPYPFYSEQSGGLNQVMMIDDGTSAFQMRVEMIRRAKKHISVEYFLFNTDSAGKILANELIAAAGRGVKVRVLVDKLLNLQMNEYYAKHLLEKKVKIKYYNDASIIQPSSAQFRNHRKLLAVDDLEAMTGGRNLGDEYFDNDREFNFNDRDVYVKGPMVKSMRDSFDKFYFHEISIQPDLTKVKNENKLKAATDFFKENNADKATRVRMQALGRRAISAKKLHTCPVLSFASDAPGGNFIRRLTKEYETDYRHLREVLRDKVEAIDKSLFISSPYMMHNKRTDQLYKSLMDKKVKVSIYTNSLASTDGIFVSAQMYTGVKNWRESGVNIYFHDGKLSGPTQEAATYAKNARWGTHSKTQIYETSRYTEVMIGTYNIDNRSNFYNTEMALFCKGNNEFTAEVKKSLIDLARQGLKVNRDMTATDRHGKITNIYGESDQEVLKMKAATIPTWLIKFLM